MISGKVAWHDYCMSDCLVLMTTTTWGLLDRKFWWVRSWRCVCLVIWFCYHLIAKPGNKTAVPSWPDPDNVYSSVVIKSLYDYNIIGRCESFLAATKQLYKWYFPSVCPSVRQSVRLSVCLSHLFHHVPIIVSSWNVQELLPWSKVMSMQKVKVRGQRLRSQRSTPNFAVSGL